MAKNAALLTTSQFASRAGIPVSAVTRLIRQGKIKAEKVSGKWMIAPDQLKVRNAPPAADSKTSAEKKSGPAASAKKSIPEKKRSAGAKKRYSVAEFAEMTYLTEKGVMQWLKEGKLTGGQDQNGRWFVDAVSLDVPNVRRLLREEWAQ